MHTDTSDISLLQAWQRHRDAEAFHAIVERHARLVYNTCRHILRNDADAADLSQECFLCLAATPPDIQYSLSGWLHRLATHRSLDYLKSASRRRDREIRYARETTVAGRDEQADLMAMLDEAIDALPDDIRIPVIEHFLHQKSHQEVADGLGIPRRTVTYRINNGVERLRDQLKRKGVILPGAGLVLALEAQKAGAAQVPARVYEALGRHALVGTPSSALPAGATGLATAVLLKKGWIAAAVVVGLAIAWWLAAGGHLGRSPNGGPASTPIAESGESEESQTDAVAVQGAGQTPPAPAVRHTLTQDMPGAGKITGRVYDADSNAPIPDTVVVVASETGSATRATCTTDAFGNYDSPLLPEGTYLIYRDYTPGYAATKRRGVGRTLKEPARIGGTHVNLTRDVNVDLPVRKGLKLGGRVLDKRERGIPGATVYACGYGEENGQITQTDLEGRFDLAGFSPTSDLHVRVTKAGFGEVALSNVVLTAPGKDDLTIHLPNAGSVSGVVVDSAGTPLEGARIEAVHFQHYGAWSFDYPRGVSDEDGAFAIEDLAPALYTLQIFPADHEFYADQRATKIALSEGEQRRDVRLVLGAGEGLDAGGRVSDTDGAAIEGVSVFMYGPVERQVETDQMGNFLVKGLASGLYQLTPFKKGYRPIVEDYFAFNREVAASRYDYQLVLEKFDMKLAGIVRDAETGEPLSGFEVVADTSPGSGAITPGIWYSAVQFDNPDGSFIVEIQSSTRPDSAESGVPSCTVYVRKSGYAPAMAVASEMRDGDTLYAEISLPRGRNYEGKVVDHNGASVYGAVIAEGQVDRRMPWGLNKLATTNADGHFEIEGISESVAKISAIHPSYATVSAELPAVSDRVLLRFAAAGRIQGHVYLDGAPVPMARMMVQKDLEILNTSDSQHGATDQEGAFHFGQLIPGPYRVITSRTEGANFVFNHVVRVVVNEGQVTNVNLRLSGGATLAGSILIDGQPPAEVLLTYEVETEDGAAEHKPRVNADGTWRIEEATPGAGTLTMRGFTGDGEERSRTIEIELAPGEERVLDIDLTDESDGDPPTE